MSLRIRPFWTNSWNRGCFWLRRTFFWNRSSKSISQSFSALCAAACEHFSSILGCHSLHKAVLVLSLKLLGLVSSFHLFSSSLFFFCISRYGYSYTLQSYQHLIIITYLFPLVKRFFAFFISFFSLFILSVILFWFFTIFSLKFPAIRGIIA